MRIEETKRQIWQGAACACRSCRRQACYGEISIISVDEYTIRRDVDTGQESNCGPVRNADCNPFPLRGLRRLSAPQVFDRAGSHYNRGNLVFDSDGNTGPLGAMA